MGKVRVQYGKKTIVPTSTTLLTKIIGIIIFSLDSTQVRNGVFVNCQS